MITKEEIQNFIKEKGGKAEDFIIRTPDEEKSYLDNFREAEIEKAIDPKTKEIHSKYDDIIFSVTGLKKNPGEKTLDFNKRVLADLKSNADKIAEYEAQLADLKEKVGKGADARILADLENVRSEFATFKSAKEKELDDLRKETEVSRKKSLIESEINAYEFDPLIKENVLKVYKETVINALIGSSEFRDGQLVFLDEKGNPLRNQANNLAPYSPTEIIGERLKDVIKQKRIIGGPPKLGDPKGSPRSLPDTVKTKVELSEHLMKEGLKRGTKEYDEAFTELGKDLPLE